MSEHKIKILWEKGVTDFIDNRYSRVHKWILDSELEIPASASPSNVPLPFSDPNVIDPEEAFLASVSSCHMLCFLNICAKRKICIEEYSDEALGFMNKNDPNFSFIEKIVLQPKVKFSGDKIPSHDEHVSIHNEAHKRCFISNSVRSNIVVNFCQEEGIKKMMQR